MEAELVSDESLLQHEVLAESTSQVCSVASGLYSSSTPLALPTAQQVVTAPLTFLFCSMWAIMLLVLEEF